MASLHRQKGKRPGFKVRWRDSEGKQKALWLGNVSQRSADTFFRHLSELISAKSAGVPPAADSEAWAAELTGRLRKRLVQLGLAEPERARALSDAGRKLGPFVDAYIAGRTDIKPRTEINFKQVRRLLVEFFGEDHALSEITPADADRWRRWLLARPMAEATVSKHVKRAKTMFREAVRDRLLRSSPFSDQKGGSESNRDRQHFIDRATAASVLAACPDDDWRLIFALARFGGMRCPSEVTGLRWTDVLWDQDRLRIDSPKAGLRFCPIFPEIRPLLEQAFDDAPDGAVHCVQRYRANANLGTQMKRIIEQAGCKAWPKLFVNLRASRRTELQQRFPSHVVDEWLGHSTAVAEKHYLMVTSDQWAAGATQATGDMAALTEGGIIADGAGDGLVERRGNAGGNISARQRASGEITNKKSPAFAGVDASSVPGILDQVPPHGLEP